MTATGEFWDETVDPAVETRPAQVLLEVPGACPAECTARQTVAALDRGQPTPSTLPHYRQAAVTPCEYFVVESPPEVWINGKLYYFEWITITWRCNAAVVFQLTQYPNLVAYVPWLDCPTGESCGIEIHVRYVARAGCCPPAVDAVEVLDIDSQPLNRGTGPPACPDIYETIWPIAFSGYVVPFADSQPDVCCYEIPFTDLLAGDCSGGDILYEVQWTNTCSGCQWRVTVRSLKRGVNVRVCISKLANDNIRLEVIRVTPSLELGQYIQRLTGTCTLPPPFLMDVWQCVLADSLPDLWCQPTPAPCVPGFPPNFTWRGRLDIPPETHQLTPPWDVCEGVTWLAANGPFTIPDNVDGTYGTVQLTVLSSTNP